VDSCAIIIQKRWREIKKKKQIESKGLYRRSGGREARWAKLSKLAQWEMRCYMLMDHPTSSWHAAMINRVIVLSIFLSIICFILETMPELWYHVTYQFWFNIEMTCTIIFTIECTLRFWSCKANENIKWRWQFFTVPLNLCDILAILPFYVDQVIGVMTTSDSKSLRGLRVFRLVRVFRVFKLGRHSRGVRLMFAALSNSFGALVVLLFFLSIAVVLFSSCVYYMEKIDCYIDMDKPYEEIKDDIAQMEFECAQNMTPVWRKGFWSKGLCCDEYGSPNDFPSIAHAFWWCIVTMTTVGYGDVYPRTTQGRLVAAVAILNGILVIALPVAIVSRRFQEVYDEDQKMEEEMKQLERASSQPARVKSLTCLKREISAQCIIAEVQRRSTLTPSPRTVSSPKTANNSTRGEKSEPRSSRPGSVVKQEAHVIPKPRGTCQPASHSTRSPVIAPPSRGENAANDEASEPQRSESDASICFVSEASPSPEPRRGKLNSNREESSSFMFINNYKPQREESPDKPRVVEISGHQQPRAPESPDKPIVVEGIRSSRINWNMSNEKKYPSCWEKPNWCNIQDPTLVAVYEAKRLKAKEPADAWDLNTEKMAMSKTRTSGGQRKSDSMRASASFIEAQDMSYISLNDESSNALIKNISSFMCDYQDILTDHCRIEQSLSHRKAQLNESISDFLDMLTSNT